MTAARWGAVVAACMLGASARAQEPAQGGAERLPPSGEELAAACVALLNGEQPQGLDAAEVRPRCESLVRRPSAGPSVEAGVGRQPLDAGTQARASFEEAGRELVGRGDQAPLRAGRTNRGDARSLLTTNPIGWFSGLGVNATFSRAIEAFPKLSWIAAARYSRANASNGNVTSVGLGTGADLFVFGRNNEGLRIGPRLEVSFGNEDFGETTTYGRAGVSGELGYNFIASNGISALAAVGLGGRIAGDEQNESFTSFTGGELGPYVKIGLGYAF